MLTLEQIAQNLNVSTDSPVAQEIYKTNILKEKGFKDVSNTKGKFYLTPEDAKELEAIGPIDDSLFIPGVDYDANQKKYKAVLSRKLTLEDAFALVQPINPNMRELTKEELNEVASFKAENGCEKVFVDTTYAKIKIFPIFNPAQEEFIKEIFFKGTWSRFDRAILVTLNLKYDTVEELFEAYSNEIDN